MKFGFVKASVAGILPAVVGVLLHPPAGFPGNESNGFLNTVLSLDLWQADEIAFSNFKYNFPSSYLRFSLEYLIGVALFFAAWLWMKKAENIKNSKTAKKEINEQKGKKAPSKTKQKPKRNEERCKGIFVPALMYISVFLLNFLPMFFLYHSVIFSLLFVIPLFTVFVMYYFGESGTVALLKKADELIDRHTVIVVLFVLLYAGSSIVERNVLYSYITRIYT